MSTDTILFEQSVAAYPDGVIYKDFAWPGSLALLPGGKLLAAFNSYRMKADGFLIPEALGIYSDDGGRTWEAPQMLFGGEGLSATSSDPNEEYCDPSIVIVNERVVHLYAVSRRHIPGSWNLSRTWTWRRASVDGGLTFGAPERVPTPRRYISGTVKPGLRLRNGSLIRPYDWDIPAERGRPVGTQGTMESACGFFISNDDGQSWQASVDLHIIAEKGCSELMEAAAGLCEPAAVELPDGELFALFRTSANRLWQSRSRDRGWTWLPPEPSPLESNDCPAALLRLDDGAVLVVYNDHPTLRARLSACLSTDRCRTWSPSRLLGPEGHPDIPEASYPQVCLLPDGTIVVIYTQTRAVIQESHATALPDWMAEDERYHIRCARFNRAWVEG